MTNGQCDVYLYFISKKLGYEKLVEFGGEGWCEYTTDSEEIVIRYSYGYHQTKYGQMMLEFVGMTKEQFIEMSLMSLKDEIIKNWKRDSDTDLSNALSQISLDSYFLVDIDRLIISVSEITKRINSITGENYTIDDIISMIGAHHSSGDTVFTGEDLIIYAE
jgi:hypothetical protein